MSKPTDRPDAATTRGDVECGCRAEMFLCVVCGERLPHSLSGQPLVDAVQVSESIRFVHRECEAAPATGVLTREALDKAFAAVAKQGSTPRHDCRFDGHILQWNPYGFAWCIYCRASEAEVERPS